MKLKQIYRGASSILINTAISIHILYKFYVSLEGVINGVFLHCGLVDMKKEGLFKSQGDVRKIK